MRLSSAKFNSCVVLLLILISFGKVYSQDITVGTDIVSRYVWRGFDLGKNSPSIQPSINFGLSGFSLGFWGAYTFSSPDALEEIDITAGYSHELGKFGSLDLAVTDYTNPNNGIKLGNIHDQNDAKGPGAHSVEMCIGYTGPESYPFSLSFNMFLYNVENNPVYVELGYTATIKEIELKTFIGGTTGDHAQYLNPDGILDYTGYYEVQKFSIINLGFTATKIIKVTENFSIPLFGSVMLNPAAEKMFYVVGFSL